MLMIVDVYLFWGAWQDLRKKKVRTEYLWFGGMLGIIYRSLGMAAGFGLLRDWLLAFVPGIVMLFVAKITEEKIGYGDGWIFLILGNFLDMMELWYVLQISVLLVVFVSLVLLWSKKVTKEYQIPFLPFLWGSYTLLWGLKYV